MLLFHAQTERELRSLANKLPHALGIFGEVGSGLTVTARFLAELADCQVNYIYPEKKDQIDRAEGSVTIDMIRQLYQTTRGKSQAKRCYVIAGADRMTTEAANAFLKLLEEPAANVTFILLANNEATLLATVRSRLTPVRIRRISQKQSLELLGSLEVTDATKRAQLLFIAEGRPALLARLASDDIAFDKEADILRKARSFISTSTYQRLQIAEQVRQSRTDAIKLLNYAIELIMFDAIKKQQLPSRNRDFMTAYEQGITKLRRNGNVRLTLAQVAVGGA